METKKIVGSVDILPEIIADITTNVTDVSTFATKIEEYVNQNTTNLLDAVLLGAINLHVSDIHIEPEQDQIRLRIRLDGVLRDILFFKKDVHQKLLNRLKLLSKIKLNIDNKPQDGRFSISINDELVEIRTSTLPAEYGESVVMRILNPANSNSLDSLGLRPDLYNIFSEQIKKPNGMIVVTGPTGSGKTTTLYAFLLKIQNPEIKIITIEDPIEYHIQGVSQTQVAAGESHISQMSGETVTEKGYSFSEGLRSIVRQDPDVILVGEIRDLETAKIALQASLTGHLVLSTLHTNDAAGTIPRLVDLGTEVASVASALKMVIAQRLVRKVCAACSTMVAPTKEELEVIEKGLKNLPTTIEVPKEFNIAKVSETGCKECNTTGYKGRTGLYEVFLVNPEIERFILTNPPVSAIKEMAVKNGMVTIWQSGLLEVVSGKTTLEEIQKVVETD